jgi:hypothetical protein
MPVGLEHLARMAREGDDCRSELLTAGDSKNLTDKMAMPLMHTIEKTDGGHAWRQRCSLFTEVNNLHFVGKGKKKFAILEKKFGYLSFLV